MYAFCKPDLIEEFNNRSFKSKIYPNPAEDVLHIEIVRNYSQNLYCQIYDIFGQLIMNCSLGNDYMIDKGLNLSSLSSGIYLIRIVDSSDSVIESQKLIVH